MTNVSPAVVAAATVRPGEMFQVLTPDGELTAACRALDIDIESVQDLYSDMVLARRLDHEALALQRQGELSLWLMSWGQEAAQVGSVRALRSTDMIFPSYREHAVALCRGVSVAGLLSQWRGLVHSGWDPEKHRFHIYSLVLGSQTLHATGYAVGAALEGTDEVVVTYFGDGASSQGDVNEAMNWAAAGSLPVLFFCQDNQWAISTPVSLQMRTPLHVRAAGFGLHAYHVDGNDVLAVRQVTELAAARIRDGGGPGLVEATTFRFAGHSSSDDPTRYRTEVEVDSWRLRDPLVRVERFLRSAGVAEAFFEELATEADAFAARIREECRALKGPGLAELFEDVYAEPHPALAAERAEHRRLLEFGGVA